MSTDALSAHASRRSPLGRRATELLIVGTLGGGGIHRYVDEQADRLSDDLDVSVYDMASEPTGSGVRWFIASLLRSIWAAIRFPFRSPPDIAHVHTSHRFSFYRASFYVFFAALVWRVPVVLHIHGSSFDDFAATDVAGVRWLQAAVFDMVDDVIVLSEYWREVLSDRVPEEKLHVLPNAVDPDEYDPGFGGDPPHVVFVSNLVARKGVRELVDALRTLLTRDVDFRASIAGRGPLAEEVERLAAAEDRVEYHGYVSEPAKRELLDDGAIFVLPTYAEGLPIAMLEGMAGGNAVVSTTVGSIPEVIEDDNGILVEPGDADALADALLTLIDSPGETRAKADRNRSLVEERYSWTRAAERLGQIYASTHRGQPLPRA